MIKNNNDAFNDFLDTLIKQPGTNEDIRILASRIRNDEEFCLAYLHFTGIMMTRFPDLFNMLLEATRKTLLEKVINNAFKDIK